MKKKKGKKDELLVSEEKEVALVRAGREKKLYRRRVINKVNTFPAVQRGCKGEQKEGILDVKSDKKVNCLCNFSQSAQI